MEYPLDQKRASDAYEALVKYLAICQRSEKECRDKLYDKGFHKNEVEFAIDKAKGYHYVDDEEYVRNFLMYNKHKYGTKKLSYKLTMEKGVDKRLVENMIADNIDEDYEKEICRGFAEKCIKQKRIEDKSQLRKLTAFLYQKGFDFGIINSVISDIFDVTDDSI